MRKSVHNFRVERDSLGEVMVPAHAMWGAQTQRAIGNFKLSGLVMPRGFIRALGLIKAIAAETNQQLGLLDSRCATAISLAALEVASGKHDAQFPVDVFQTGSGTSSNMNVNEVIAYLASGDSKLHIDANDHVNFGQSSNDVIPTALHVAAALIVHEQLLPALISLQKTIEAKARSLKKQVKTGRTHLMDAMPLRFDQELSGWAQQIRNARARVLTAQPRILAIAQGGTAVGTGINAHPRFSKIFAGRLAKHTGVKFVPSPNFFESLATVDAAAELSAQLKVVACSLMKIANDLRWMNSGPLSGLGEITLPILQPGSSIMPGKVNPVIPEAVCMVAAQVIGNDAAITIAAQSGNFQLNVMLPLVAYNLLQSLQLLTNAVCALDDKVIAGFSVNSAHIDSSLSNNPILITALNRQIGYAQGAKIAKRVSAEKKTLLEIALEETTLSGQELRRMLNPRNLTKGGIQ